MIRRTSVILGALVLVSCGRPAQLGHKVLATVPHDAECYTQGLEFSGPRLFESSGGYGISNVREVDPATGEVLRRRPLARHVFAEGITLFDGRLYVLTWKENTAYVLDPDSFRFLDLHEYEGEGWGLTHNGSDLIMSNGTSTIRFRDPADFSVKREITVTDRGREIDQINELEFIDGQIFANIYQSDRIARISPETGRVTGWLDLSALRKQLPRPHRAEELNGIAREPATGRILVTGKLWPRAFFIEIVE